MRPRLSGLGRVKDAPPKQVEAGTAVHLTLHQLESVNLPLHHPVAPGQLQCRSHSILIAPKAARKGSIGGAFRSFEPSRLRCNSRLRIMSNSPRAVWASAAISGEARKSAFR